MNLDSEYHPLFLPQPGGREDYEPEAFSRIRIFRAEPAGVVQCPRDYLPEEIADAQALADQFGGGVYELWALHKNGQLYARRTVRLPGAPKPLGVPAVTHDQAPSVAAPAASAGPGLPSMDPLVAFILQSTREQAAQMMQLQQAQQTQTLSIMATMIQAMAQMQGNRESPADMLRSFAELTKAQQAPAAPQGASAIRDVLETSRLIREEAERARPEPPPPPEPDPTDTVAKLIGAVGPVLMALAPNPAPPPAPPPALNPIATAASVAAALGETK